MAKFETYERSLELAVAVKPVIEIVSARDRSLADQMKRASASICLNLSEGAHRKGRDRTNLYRVASGSAAELKTALQLALSWGYVTADTARSAQDLNERVCAMLWRLLNPSPEKRNRPPSS